MYEIYEILPNDTINTIAQKYNTSAQVISQLNGISIDMPLMVGNSLIVPKMISPYFDYYTIKKGDNLYKLAQEYDIDYKILAQINGLDLDDYIYPNQVIMIPKKNVKYYVTKDNDTILDIANNLNTSLNNILSQNSKIYVLPEQLLVFRAN